MQIRTLRPGLLVSLKTRVRGGVSYRKLDIERAQVDPDTGAEISRWDTTKIVRDPEEQKRASQTASKGRYLVAKLCAESEHGLLCPEERIGELKAAIAEARELCDEYNATAVHTRVEVNVVCGRVVADDVEATRALFSETERFMEAMQTGLKELDVEKVRAACKKALSVGQMLAPSANEQVVAAVKAARAQATKIVAAGEQVAIELDENALATIGQARGAFLDFDSYDDGTDFGPAPVQGRAIDFWGTDDEGEVPADPDDIARDGFGNKLEFDDVESESAAV